MIDVKIIKKPKKEGGTTILAGGFSTTGNDGATGGTVKEAAYARRAGEAETAKAAEEAAHAKTADVAKEAETLSESSPVLEQVLRKDRDDRTPYKLASDRGFEAGRYQAGASGGFFGMDQQTGDSLAEIGRLFVRVRAYFEQLVIREKESLQGDRIVTPEGGVTIISQAVHAHPSTDNQNPTTDNEYPPVYEVTHADGTKHWRCLFVTEQDGEGREASLTVGAQAISHTFNATPGAANKVSNSRWWRLVTAVSNDFLTDTDGNRYGYIDLSQSDCEAGSDTPKAGEAMAQLGHHTDKTRQTAIEISTTGADAPSIKLYQGIDSYTLAGKDIISYGYDPAKGNAYFRCLGDTYIGDPDGSTFIRYDETTKALDIKAKVTILPSSTIGDKPLDDYFKDLIPEVSKEDIETYVNAIIDPKIEGIQNQIDGVIETWFYNGVPTLTTYPANEWNTDELKIQHLGDLYYDNNTGTAYRFSQNADKSYYWNTITDDAITKALAAAQTAQDTADAKRRTFTQQPMPPYDKGDIWVNATYAPDYDNDILRCNTAKAKGASFDIADWGLASKYTDDTKAQAALDRFTAWAADGKFSPIERQELDMELRRIDGDKTASDGRYALYADLVSKVEGLSASKAAYDTAYGAYRASITAVQGATPDSDGCVAVPSDFSALMTAYYSALAAFEEKMATAQKVYTANKVADYDYLKLALPQKTEINGGVAITSLLALGYDANDGNGWKAYAGMNGINLSPKSIATWWGGPMADRFATPAPSDYAAALVRMDGSAYWAKGNIGFNADGSGWLGNDLTGIKFNALGQMTFGSGVTFNVNNIQGLQTTLDTLGNFNIGLSNLLIPCDANNKEISWGEATQSDGAGGFKAKSIKAKVGLWSVDFISARGQNTLGGGASGGATELRMLSDVLLTNPVNGHVLTYDGSKWVNQTLKTGLDESALAAYLTQNNYAKKSDIPSLTGYATESWVSANFNKYELPTASATVKGGVKVGSGLTIASEVLAVSLSASHIPSLDWSKITSGKPTTLAGYGITDGLTANAAASTYVKKSGDTMSGVLRVKANMYEDAYDGALDMLNSNIFNLNSIYTADLADSSAEGLHFYRDTTHVDTFWVSNGVMRFSPNRALGNDAAGYEVLHGGNYASILDGRYYTESEINTKLGSYVTLGTAQTITANKTVSAQILKSISGHSWVNGRSGALIRSISAGASQYIPLWSAKSEHGTWDCGTYTSNRLHFSYITDAHFNAQTNTQTANIFFDIDGTVNCNQLRIGSCTITYDSSTGMLKLDKGIYSTGAVSARGANSSGGSSGGGASYNRLDAWGDYATSKSGYVLSAGLGYDLHTRLGNVYTKNDVNSLLGGYQPKGNYVDIASAQRITGKKTFGGGFAMTSGAENPNMPYFLGIDAYADGGTVKYITASKVSAAINALSRTGGSMANTNVVANLNADLLDGLHQSSFVRRYSVSGNDPLNALQKNFSTLVGNEGCSVKLMHNSHSMAFGWFLGGYDYAHAYGGWFISQYGTPMWVGADNGTWKYKTFAFTDSTVANANALGGVAAASYATQSWVNGKGYATASALSSGLSGKVSKSGDTMTGVLHVNVNNTTFDIGGQNSAWVHLYSNVSCIFNRALYVQGEIYAGSSYNQKVWHQGNDGSGSGLDADLLDGIHASTFLYYKGGLTSASKAIAGVGLYGWGITASGNGGFSWAYGDSIVFQGHSTWYNRLDFCISGQIDFWHSINPSSLDGAMSKVGTLAFLHSNVASATKLQTARSIWGQSFDGTGNVSGSLSGVTDLTASGKVLVGTATSSYALNCASFICDSWIRTKSATGWYNETYGGGWYMQNNAYIENYGSKRIKISGISDYYGIWLNGSGCCCEGYGGTSWNGGHGGLNVGCTNNSAQTPLLVAYRTGGGMSGDNRMFAMEMLNSGEVLRFCMRSKIVMQLYPNQSVHVPGGMWSDGYVSARGQNTSSDARLKQIIKSASLDIKAIANAPSVMFRWKKDGRQDVGSIAQYWRGIIPQLAPDMPDGSMGLQYGKTALLASIAVARKVVDHETRIRTLERENAELKRELQRLKTA